MNNVLALILFFNGTDLAGAQVIGLTKDVQTCEGVLARLVEQHAGELPKGVKAVPACLDATPGTVRPSSNQQATQL